MLSFSDYSDKDSFYFKIANALFTTFEDNPELVDALAELSGGVKEKYLRNALDYMKQESGSAQAFVKDKIGVTDEEIGLLRTYYLERFWFCQIIAINKNGTRGRSKLKEYTK